MEIFTLAISGVTPDGESFEDIVRVGPAPDLATAIMWEKSALSDCKYVEVRESPDARAEYSDALRTLKWD